MMGNIFSGALLTFGVIGISFVDEISRSGNEIEAGLVLFFSILAVLFSQILRIK